jgi:hypothetical protein
MSYMLTGIMGEHFVLWKMSSLGDQGQFVNVVAKLHNKNVLLLGVEVATQLRTKDSQRIARAVTTDRRLQKICEYAHREVLTLDRDALRIPRSPRSGR